MREKQAVTYAVVYCVGMAGYSALEILWRGYTHWTMALTGGACLTLLFRLDAKTPHWPLLARCAAGCGIITGMEFLVGCAVNIGLGWHVWDYSQMPLQLLGQVCLVFSALWFLLCIPLMAAASLLRRSMVRRSAGWHLPPRAP